MDRISDRIAALPSDSRYFSLEFFPPKTQAGTENLTPRLTRLSQLQPLFVTVTWGAGGSTATKSLELAETCQRAGLITCLHLTCTNMRQSVLDHALAEAKRIGIRNILALRGDEPRPGEYGEHGVPTNGHTNGQHGEEEQVQFKYAVDLVKYIRHHFGDYFCVGVAAYPEGHATSAWPEHQSVEHDLPYLVEKTQAGADFIMTQLFYDVDAYTSFVQRLRTHPSGAFKNIPIIPGLMPIQSWGSIRRVTKLCNAKIPSPVLDELERAKGDDEQVKLIGLQTLCDMIRSMTETHKSTSNSPIGFHLYTLNLEKIVAQILERSDLIPASIQDQESDLTSAVEDGPPISTTADTNGISNKTRKRLSSANSTTFNRAIITRSSASSQGTPHPSLEAFEDEAGVPRDKVPNRANTLAIAEGEGSLGRSATWDDFPNGRFGDARSPAYGSIDGYGPSLHVSRRRAVELWGHPQTFDDVTALFKRYLLGELEGLPWSEEPLSAETAMIRAELLRMNEEKGWWTVASQPAVDCARSSDPVVGWGPRRGGWVWQRPFIELFLPTSSLPSLLSTLSAHTTQTLTYYATTSAPSTFTTNASSPSHTNPVTWGTFPGAEIKTPTIIEAESFRAWAEEAFGLWSRWAACYDRGSASERFLNGLSRGGCALVCVVGVEYRRGGEIWDLLLGEGEGEGEGV